MAPKNFHDGGEALHLQVSRGKARGARFVHKFGKNDGINSSIETVWAAGGLHYNPTTAGTVDFVSSSAEDAVGGDGLAAIVVQGLDTNYVEVEESLTLTGLTTATTTTEFLRVNRTYGTDLGSGATIATNPQFSNLGNITGTHNNLTTPNDVVVYIPANVGQTQLALYTIPDGHTGYLYHFGASTGKESTGAGTNPVTTVRLLQRLSDGAPQSWRIMDEFILKDSIDEVDYPFPIEIPEHTDMEVRAFTSSETVPVSAHFDVLLLENDS
jgi:hypothetical protein